MTIPFPELFKKGRIGKTEIRNRIVMVPMSTNFPNENGGVTNELINYYAERAKGGVGLVIVESACVDFPVGRNGATKLRCDQPTFVPGLSRLVDAVHSYGAKILLQIQHAGPSTSIEKTLGQQPVAPSEVSGTQGLVLARELSIEDIRRLESEFAKVAGYATEAGFDGIEVHGAHSYLIAQFLSPLGNKRKDEYGGNLENRARFLLETVDQIREKIGPRSIISVRINGDESSEGGLTTEDSRQIAQMLENRGVDVIDVSSGLKRHADSLSMYKTQGWRVAITEEIKRSVNIPVIVSGGIKDPDFAEDILAKGSADFIGLGRALIADPFWARKASRGDHRRIRTCISCNIGCAQRRISGYRAIKCSINPDVGQEGRSYVPLDNGSKRRNVVVVGAGPGGLNAALEAARRGYSVTVFEKRGEIGGQVNIASVPPCKGVFHKYIGFLRDSLMEYDVQVLINEEATFQKIRSLEPKAVIFATGSKPVIPSRIPGIEEEKVVTAHDLLRQKPDLEGENVAVLGGGLVGCEVADLLAEKNSVTIVEMLNSLAADAERINRSALLGRLEAMNVKIMLNSCLEKIGKGFLEIRNNEGLELVPFDLLVLSIGVVPDCPVWIDEIRGTGAEVYLIGDAKGPGRLINAVSEGAAVGRNL